MDAAPACYRFVTTVKSQTRYALNRLRKLNPQLAELVDVRVLQEVADR